MDALEATAGLLIAQARNQGAADICSILVDRADNNNALYQIDIIEVFEGYLKKAGDNE